MAGEQSAQHDPYKRIELNRNMKLRLPNQQKPCVSNHRDHDQNQFSGLEKGPAGPGGRAGSSENSRTVGIFS